MTQFGEKPDITLEEAFDRLLKSVDGSTFTSYELGKRKWLGMDRFEDIWHLDPKKPLSKLSQADIDDHKAERKDEGLKANSINVEIRTMRRVLNFNKKRFKVNEDLELVELPKFQKTRFLTAEEELAIAQRLLAHKGSPSYDKAHDLFVFLIDTGVRVSEALALEWQDVDLTNRQIENYNIKTEIVSLVPISNRVHELLERLHNQRQPFMEMSRAVRHLRKTISDTSNGNRRIVARRGAATVHTLRDTYASRLATQGMSLAKIAKLLGHTSTKMTEKYAQLENQDVVGEARTFLNRA